MNDAEFPSPCRLARQGRPFQHIEVSIGAVQIVHAGTLFYYNGTQVFEGRGIAGGRYIGVLADSTNGSDSYVVVEVAEERMQKFHTGAPDLKALLVEESKDGWYLAEVRDGFTGPLALQEQSGADVETNLTPEDDFVLGVLSHMVVQQRRPHLPIDGRAQGLWSAGSP